MLPDAKVGVDPTTLPAASATTTLCGTGDAFSKTSVTDPAEAVSLVCWKASIPDGSAWSVSFAVPVALAGAPVGPLAPVAGVLAVVAVVPVLVVDLVLDEPQPARASAPTTQATDGVRSPIFKTIASDSLTGPTDSRRCRRSPSHPGALLESSAASFNPVPRGQEGMIR